MVNFTLAEVNYVILQPFVLDSGFGVVIVTRLARFHLRTLVESHPVPVHLQPTTVIHSLLLPLKLAHFFSDCHTLRNWTNGFLALLGVNSKQSPDAFTDFAPPLYFSLRAKEKDKRSDLRLFQFYHHLRQRSGLPCKYEHAANNSSSWHNCWKSIVRSCTETRVR